MGEFPVTETDDGEALRGAEASAVPPVAADGTAGNELDAVELDNLIDVGVALEDGEEVAPGKDGEELPGVREGALRVYGWSHGGRNDSGATRCARCGVLNDGGDERDVGDDDNGDAGGESGYICGEPGELRVVDFGFPGAVAGGLDGVENDEMVALVIKGVVGGAEAVDEHLLAVAGAGERYATADEDAELVMIADGVVDLEADGLLCVGVEVEEAVSLLPGDGHCIEDVIAALNDEVSANGGGLFEGEGAACSGGELGLDMGVSEEDEVESTGWFGGSGQRQEGCSGGSPSTEGDKFSSIQPFHTAHRSTRRMKSSPGKLTEMGRDVG